MLTASLIYLLVLGVILGSCVRTVYLGLTLPPALRRKEEPAVCGRCGYAFGPGHGEVCPECGTRYVEAGVLTRPLARKLRPSANHVLGSLGFGLLLLWSTVGSIAFAVLESRYADDELLGVVIFFAGAGLCVVSLVISVIVVVRRRSKLFAPNWDRSVGDGRGVRV